MRNTARKGSIVWIGLLLMAVAMTGAMPCNAGPITEGVWYQFGFGGAGSIATGCDPADPAGPFCLSSSGTPTEFADAPAWTITSAVDLTFVIVDAFDSGDRFEAFNGGNSLGLTSAPGAASCGDDPAVCLTTAGMSSRKFILAAGQHVLTIAAIDSPNGSGSGYFQVAAVPEPSTVFLLGGGLASLALWRRRKMR